MDRLCFSKFYTQSLKLKNTLIFNKKIWKKILNLLYS